MSRPADESAWVASAVREAFDAADIDPACPEPRQLRPVPLDRILFAFPIVRREVRGLTRAAAAAELPTLRVACPALVGDLTPLAGLLFVAGGGACVLVRKDDPVARRRFSAAHELGHLLMHHRPSWLPDGTDTGDVVTDDEPADIADDEPAAVAELAAHERQANRFAAELLMPAAAVRGLHAFYADRYGTTPQFVEGHIATDLAVSRTAVRVRLAGLGLAVGV